MSASKARALVTFLRAARPFPCNAGLRGRPGYGCRQCPVDVSGGGWLTERGKQFPATFKFFRFFACGNLVPVSVITSVISLLRKLCDRFFHQKNIVRIVFLVEIINFYATIVVISPVSGTHKLGGRPVAKEFPWACWIN